MDDWQSRSIISKQRSDLIIKRIQSMKEKELVEILSAQEEMKKKLLERGPMTSLQTKILEKENISDHYRQCLIVITNELIENKEWGFLARINDCVSFTSAGELNVDDNDLLPASDNDEKKWKQIEYLDSRIWRDIVRRLEECNGSK